MHLQHLIIRAIDGFYARKFQPLPVKQRLMQCPLVSHRGEHDNRRVMENTHDAFDRAEAAGIWGLECDVRWTRDLHPVVCHDPDTERLFGTCRQIRQMTLAEVKARFPSIPTLAETIDRYGKRLHLMVELKDEVYPDPAAQNRTLADLFSGIDAGTDYHLMSLAPHMLELIDCVASNALLPIAGIRIRSISRLALQKGWAGICGHYMLMTGRMMQRHRQQGQSVGTGFAASLNVLFREMNRGVAWIFSDRAAALQEKWHRMCSAGNQRPQPETGHTADDGHQQAAANAAGKSGHKRTGQVGTRPVDVQALTVGHQNRRNDNGR